MINHPNRKKVYPDHTFENAAREAGARVICCWEQSGPRDTQVAWMVYYLVGRTVALVHTHRDGSWEVYTPGRSIKIDATIADALARCGVASSGASECSD